MDHLTYARAQMGLSLAFHMAFAAVGVALPLFMVIADVMHLRTRDPEWRELAKKMAKGTSILFAVGAVSGTVLSFELGLLWPGFMGKFGELVGLPFAMEGFAFFTEAIFLGIYLYGRDRIPPKAHLFAGIVVALSGVASAFFVTLVNSFMNLPAPSSFTMSDGRPTLIDPSLAMWSPPWRHQTVHALLACYAATAFAMSGIHAAVLLRRPQSTLFRKALSMSLAVACIAAVLQLVSGHGSAQSIAELQPAKLAAAEAHFHTGPRAPVLIGGIPDPEAREVHGAIPIPGMLSLLAHDDPNAVVKGLDQIPREEWPPIAATHTAFDIMVGAGSAMALLAGVSAFLAWRKRGLPDHKWFLRAVVLAGPLGLAALEAGWCVTEFGRQPWIVHGAMLTKEAVTPFPHLAAPFWLFTLVYVFLGISVVFLLFRQLKSAPDASVAEAGHVH
ncbi:MAG: cytochrome ubiquinol oxidase subunit I [Minicystis sp.]